MRPRPLHESTRNDEVQGRYRRCISAGSIRAANSASSNNQARLGSDPNRRCVQYSYPHKAIIMSSSGTEHRGTEHRVTCIYLPWNMSSQVPRDMFRVLLKIQFKSSDSLTVSVILPHHLTWLPLAPRRLRDQRRIMLYIYHSIATIPHATH